MEDPEVESGGCKSCSHSGKECISKATLKGTFKRDDGVKFTASMTANGKADTACDAKALSYTNIIKTLEKFIKDYTPKIVEGIYEITYSITCDGKPTCCKSLCNDYVLEFTTYSKPQAGALTESDVAFNSSGSALIVGEEKFYKNFPLSPDDPFIGSGYVTATALIPFLDKAKKQVSTVQYKTDIVEEFLTAEDDTSVDSALSATLTNSFGLTKLVMFVPEKSSHGGAEGKFDEKISRISTKTRGTFTGKILRPLPGMLCEDPFFQSVTITSPVEVMSQVVSAKQDLSQTYIKNKYKLPFNPLIHSLPLGPGRVIVDF
jgi:hypothetical protein